MARSSNEKRAQRRQQCREALATHICTAPPRRLAKEVKLTDLPR
jgi:hypothetical protein